MIKTWAITDVGLVRKENQDTYRIARNGGVCVVCDGMGGAAGGRIASTLAAETYVAELDKVLKPDMTPEQLREASSYAVAMANQAVENRATEDAELSNMGTTLVSAIAYEGGTVITNIGDSRAYYITEAGITRITKDHSLVESMVDHGDITADEARHHPNRNLITRALGRDTNAACDGYIRPMEKGDYILLCTDGLVNTVTDQEMLFEIIHGQGEDTCLSRLMEIAKSQGAPDNVTAVLMRML
ncbi:MAG: Stp1/IreP family PP2C-type Ser/Thr phosphatase [Clostridiales bacterium]|nr:Stp1/IreP family PP2C-type Ser/Thr phosphatase [Clostridiales bacterium]MBD9199389.1 Stp1/IreP family PP2C-type Ser/Thr phosphatase [Clostridiales bacterium]